MTTMHNPILERAASLLRSAPDFPEPGTRFWDIQPVLDQPRIMDDLVQRIAAHWRELEIDVVVGFDSRGFLFGREVASQLGAAFRMARKKGKLPPPTRSFKYKLEYGEAEIELADDGFIEGKRVLLLDDLLATGGTAAAGVKLVCELGGNPIGFACIIELPKLGGRGQLINLPIQSLITVMDDTPLVGVEYCVDIYARCSLTNALLLIERLGDVPGIAMPGGRIEKHESVLAAAQRELYEETSNRGESFKYISTLTGIDRDPRGPKVSVVIEGAGHFGPLQGEPGKTRPFWVNCPPELPNANHFVFAHDTIARERYLAQFAKGTGHSIAV